jgi:glycosyltransferase A (GT-A) superfamily protein (DUF2064 family)
MARAPSSPGKSGLIRELGTRDGESLRGALLRDTFASVANLDVDKRCSSPHRSARSQVLERTCKAAEALGIPVERISQRFDVDSPPELRRLWRGVAGAESIARYTCGWRRRHPTYVLVWMVRQ